MFFLNQSEKGSSNNKLIAQVALSQTVNLKGRDHF